MVLARRYFIDRSFPLHVDAVHVTVTWVGGGEGRGGDGKGCSVPWTAAGGQS